MDDLKDNLRHMLEHVMETLGPMRDYVTPTSAVIGLLAGLVVYWLIKRNKYNLPPGPTPLPLIGNYSLLGDKLMHETLAKLGEKYGPVITVQMGPLRMVVLNTIETTLEALVKKGADFADRPNFTSAMEMSEGGKDIAFAQYTPTWKLHRKIAGSGLRHYLKGGKLEEAIHGSLTQTIRRFEEQKEQPFIPHSYIDYTMCNILASLCFQKVYDFDDPKLKHIMDVDNALIEKFGSGFLEDLFPTLRKVWPSRRYLDLMATVRELFEFINGELAQHMADFDEGNIKDFTDGLILARKEAENEEDPVLLSQLTDVHLRQTLGDIFFAGLDTSRMTLQWCVLYIAGHPDLQKRAQTEIDMAVGRDRLPGLDDRDAMPYTEAILHEVMRIASVAPLGVPHAARVDSKIGGYDVPKETMVMVNHWALHNDPKHWKDPSKFDPERFLDAKGNLAPKPISWLPFSAGRRVCLGESAAKPELHLILAILLHQFEIKLPPGVAADYSADSTTFAGFTANKYKIVAVKRN